MRNHKHCHWLQDLQEAVKESLGVRLYFTVQSQRFKFFDCAVNYSLPYYVSVSQAIAFLVPLTFQQNKSFLNLNKRLGYLFNLSSLYSLLQFLRSTVSVLSRAAQLTQNPILSTQLQVRCVALMWGESVKYHVSATWVIWEIKMSCYPAFSMPSRQDGFTLYVSPKQRVA